MKFGMTYPLMGNDNGDNGLGGGSGNQGPGETGTAGDSGFGSAIGGALGGLAGGALGGPLGGALGSSIGKGIGGSIGSSSGFGSGGSSERGGGDNFGGGYGGGLGGNDGGGGNDVGGALSGSRTTGVNTMASQSSAANTQASYEQQALDYLMRTEQIPQQFREGALQQLGGIAGLEGGTGSQQDVIDRAKNSPLYSAIMGGQQAGEQAILRNASATGGLRSGNVQGALTDYGSQLDNRALLESYNQQMSGLQGLAALPSNANQIASTQAGIGNTLAMGDVAAQQAAQAKKGQNTSLALGLLGNETVQKGIGAAWDWVSDYN